jgi:hypothetical protein
MNRQQRRAKKKNSMVLNKSAAWLAMNTLPIKKSFADQDAQAHIELIAPAYAALDVLTGTATCEPWLDDEGFVRMIELNTFGFTLAARLHEYGTESTKATVAPLQPVFEHAADCLTYIGNRKLEIGRFRATGDELKAIRASFDLLDQLIAVSDQGHTLTALIDAKRLVEKALH